MDVLCVLCSDLDPVTLHFGSSGDVSLSSVYNGNGSHTIQYTTTVANPSYEFLMRVGGVPFPNLYPLEVGVRKSWGLVLFSDGSSGCT